MTQSPRVRRRIDDERRSAASELLRHLDHPARLRSNRLARLHEPATLHDVVQLALSRLTATQRAIIERCDIGGELNRVVARDLAVTERHFYRLRHNALAEIVRVLERPAPSAKRIAEAEPATQRALAVATALDQAGNRDAAIETLRQAAAGESNADQRMRLEAELTQQLAEAGFVHESLDRLAMLEESLVPESRPEDALRARIATAKVAVLAISEDAAESTRILSRAIVGLRAAAIGVPTLGVIEARASALLLEAERQREVGAVEAALDSATAAYQALELASGSSPLLRVDAALQMALLPMLGRPGATGIDRLEAVARSARAQGLAQKSLMIEVDMAAMQRVSGEAQRAIAAMLPILPLIRQVCSGRNLWISLLDLAASYSDAGDLRSARSLALEVIQAPGIDANTAAMAHLRLAEIALRFGRVPDALESAQFAREVFSRRGNSRLAGAALRAEAEAAHRLGDHNAATASIHAAIEMLRNASYPYAWERAAAAFRRITGNPIS
jgi:tetratricopeptide (TPR) repeat protein